MSSCTTDSSEGFPVQYPVLTPRAEAVGQAEQKALS